MALEYFKYRIDFDNTLIDRSDTPFVLGVDEAQIQLDFFIPDDQKLYFYKESGGTIIINDEVNIEDYITFINPETGNDAVTQDEFTGVTTQNASDIQLVSGVTTQNSGDIQLVSGVTTQNTLDIIYLSGQTDILTSGVTDNASDIQLVSGVTTQNTSDIQLVSGVTTQNASDIVFISGETASNDADIAYLSGQTDTKIDKVTGATGNLAIFLSDGNVEDSGVSIDEITGGTGFYFYEDRTATVNNTTTTDVAYLSGVSSTLEGGTWSIDFNALGGNTGNNKSIIVGFYIDDVLQGIEISSQANASTNVLPFVISKDLILSNGSHTFEVRFRQLGGGTSFLDYASIRARIVN